MRWYKIFGVCSFIWFYGLLLNNSACLSAGTILQEGKIQAKTVPVFHGQTHGQTKDTLTLFCKSEIRDVVSLWARRYAEDPASSDICPVSCSRDEILNQALRKGYPGFLPQESTNALDQDSFRIFPVGHIIYVPVVHPGNRYLSSLFGAGISSKELVEIFTDPRNPFWVKQDPSGNGDNPPHFYFTQGLAGMLLKDDYQIESEYTPFYIYESEERLLRALMQDPSGVGFCSLSVLSDFWDRHGKQSITLLPVTKAFTGKPGKVDPAFLIPDFFRTVKEGRYPDELITSLCYVDIPQRVPQSVDNFLAWITTTGQRYLQFSGLTQLTLNEQRSNYKALSLAWPPKERGRQISGVLIPLAIGVAFLIILFIVITLRLPVESKPGKVGGIDYGVLPGLLSPSKLNIMAGYLYDHSHTWVFVEKDGNLRVGLDSFLSGLTGPLTSITLYDIGSRVHRGEKLATLVQDGKKLEIRSPVSGTIIEKNKQLKEVPSMIHEYPLEKGWLYRIEPVSLTEESPQLLNARHYSRWLEDEIVRVKDFFTRLLQSGPGMNIHPYFQDGGELHQRLLESQPPEVWEEFQSQVLDQTIG